MSPLTLRSPSGVELIRSRLLKLVQQRAGSCEQDVTEPLTIAHLAQLLGASAAQGRAPVELTWPGKSKALAQALAPAVSTLLPCPELSWGSGSPGNLTANLYLEGDNLEALKLLGLSYNGAVKVIYIDPPYNTGKDFVYHDNFTQSKVDYEVSTGVRADGAEDNLYAQLCLAAGVRLRTNSETDGRFHSNWCSLIYPRLLLARQLLRSDGVIFISIDDYEQHNLKLICDEVFGAENFVTQLVWQRAFSPKNDAKFVSTSHDYVLMYAYDQAVFLASLQEQGLSCDFSSGQLLRHQQVGSSQTGTKELKALLDDGVFDGPKPVRLIKHLLGLAGLKAHGAELVLDFFSGSATTAQAVLELNAADNGDRRFIMVQLPEECAEDKRANSRFATICDIGRARIKAVAEKLASTMGQSLYFMHQNGAGGGDDGLNKPFYTPKLLTDKANCDLGLNVLALVPLLPLEAPVLEGACLVTTAELGERGAQSALLDESLSILGLLSAERKAQAWLYCLAAHQGIPLNLTISTKQLAGATVWCYGSDLLWLCPQPQLVLSQAWLDDLRTQMHYPQYLALRASVLARYPETQFLLAEHCKTITVLPLVSEDV